MAKKSESGSDTLLVSRRHVTRLRWVWQALGAALDDVEASLDLHEALDAARRMSTRPPTEGDAQQAAPKIQQESKAGTDKKYKVARWENSYADVVFAEVNKSPFSTDDAWETIRDIIDTGDSEPHRTSMVRSLRNDGRFATVETDQPGLWFIRIGKPPDEQEDAEE